MPETSLVIAYGTVVHVAGDVRIDGKFCRQGFNVEARKMGGLGTYMLDFATSPASNPPSAKPPLQKPPVVLATARGTTGSNNYLCYAQARSVSREEAIIHIIQTPNSAHYAQPGFIDSNFDFLILEAQG